MKKIFMSLPIFAALLMTGCTSDDIEENVKPTPVKDVITLTAELSLEDEGSRIIFDEDNGRQLYWDVNDEITIVGKNGGKVLYVASNVMEDNKRLASFTPKDDAESLTEDDFPAEAFYPASLASKVLPAEQKYDGTKLSDVNPMYAVFETAGAKAMFSNLCGLLAINLKGTLGGEVVNEIRISADEAMSGAFDVAESNGKYKAVLTQEAKQAKAGITLKCGEDGVTLSKDESTKFFVAIPEGVYHNLSIITIGNELDGGGIENDAKVMKVGASLDIKRNKFTTINEYAIDYRDSWYLLPGVFTVGEDGHKVQFTRGNLFWDGTQFGLEENQYDYPSTYDANHIGHFYFNTKAENSYGNYICDGGDSELDFAFCHYENGEYRDPSFNVYGKKGYRILMGVKPSNITDAVWGGRIDEWKYIFTLTSRMYKQTGTKFTHTGFISTSSTSIEDVQLKSSIFIYPDNYNGKKIGESGGPTTWQEINSLGIVFLPGAGIRKNGTISDTGGYARYLGAAGRYRSSSWENHEELFKNASTANYSNTWGFYSANNTASQAFPIRLVKDVKCLTVTANDIYNDETPGWWK
ncbi:MAG: hypothetical protein Q3994_03890 [Prevotella sp.]|nr:hypothetical protein [Prevotella sp.]